MQDFIRSKAEDGSSVIDLVLCLTLVAIIASAALATATTTIHTYQRNGAARQLLAELRAAQSLAITRGGVFGLQWGGDPSVMRRASQYRIVRDTTGACSLPDLDVPADGSAVIRTWRDLSSDYPGMTIQSIRDDAGNPVGSLLFNTMGASVNTCTSVAFPVILTVADRYGTTRVIEIRRAGSIRLL